VREDDRSALELVTEPIRTRVPLELTAMGVG
jgi:hypothetical protein